MEKHDLGILLGDDLDGLDGMGLAEERFEGFEMAECLNEDAGLVGRCDFVLVPGSAELRGEGK